MAYSDHERSKSRSLGFPRHKYQNASPQRASADEHKQKRSEVADSCTGLGSVLNTKVTETMKQWPLLNNASRTK